MALSMKLGTQRTDRPDHPDWSDPDDHDAGRPNRLVTSALGLPTGRALFGGLLVAIAALGIFAAHRAATAEHRVGYLIVTRPVAPGTRIEAADLALAPMSLYSRTRQQAITEPGDVIGRVALIPLNDGDLLLRSSTTASSQASDGTARRVGLALDSADAVGGDLHMGDRVDVVAVPRAEDPAVIIVRGAIVTSFGGDEASSVGSSEHLRVNLDVPNEEDARLVVEAHARGGVTLIAPSALALDPTAERDNAR